jgi:hypothetical protein
MLRVARALRTRASTPSGSPPPPRRSRCAPPASPGDVLLFGPVRAAIAGAGRRRRRLTVAQPADRPITRDRGPPGPPRPRNARPAAREGGHRHGPPRRPRRTRARWSHAVDRSPASTWRRVDPPGVRRRARRHRAWQRHDLQLGRSRAARRLERDGLRPPLGRTPPTRPPRCCAPTRTSTWYGPASRSTACRRRRGSRSAKAVCGPRCARRARHLRQARDRGHPISYGGTWTAPRATVVATVRSATPTATRGRSRRGRLRHRGRRVGVVGASAWTS